MEKAKQDAFDNARLQVIKDGYERAFECINEGLTADEAGDKTRALELYKQGRKHLLRAISVPSHGDECGGSAWESARQMQQKMQETLNNITTRLAILETSSDLESAPMETSTSVSDHSDLPTNGLYPKLQTKEKPERPSPPHVGHGPPVGAEGGMAPNLQPMLPTQQPPAYSPQAAEGHTSISYGTESGEMSLVGDEFYNSSSISTLSTQSLGEDGEQLIYIPNGVQIFFVTPDGQVSAPSYPGYLRLVRFTDNCSEGMPDRPPAFLQVCDWLYPLMAMNSPVLVCNTGVFMFPDMMAEAPGFYVGVVLSSELPVAQRELFQDLLSQMTDLRVQAPDEAAEEINLSQKVPIATPEETAPAATEKEETEKEETEKEEEKVLPEWSEKVASGILTGASWLSWGLVKGAAYTGKAIHKGASMLREHITPEDKPTQVSPTVTKSLHVAKQATGGAVKVSQFLVDGVCTVAGCVGRELAPHVKKHGGKLIPESMKKDKDGRSNIDGAMVVAASGVQGFATMWTGLESAAKDIASSVASETVTTVKHKYGAAAGQATDHAVNSAINVGITAFNIDNLGIKAVVKRTGKQTAQAILEDYKLQEKPESGKQVESLKK